MKKLCLFCLFLIVFFSFNHLTYAGSWVGGSATSMAGARNYQLWVPEGYRGGKPLPLVMMLHGCSQTAVDFAAGTQMHLLGDQFNFFVVYPEQPSSANGTNCWNWFLPEHQSRDAGEPSILAGVIRKVESEYSVRPSRIYVAGMSAGAAMSVIMGVTYPEIFSAVGASAGLEYKAGTDLTSGVLAQELGGPNPDLQGQLAFIEMGSRARRMPTIVFHGSLDLTVNNINGTQIIGQFAQTNDLIDDGFDNNSIDALPEQTLAGTAPNNGLNYTRDIYLDAAGRSIMERWLVETMTHKWSGGSANGSYTEPRGPSASFEMCRFFGLTNGKN
jgi:poly(hydroxyalkanoate) depolymerase family esterase